MGIERGLSHDVKCDKNKWHLKSKPCDNSSDVLRHWKSREHDLTKSDATFEATKHVIGQMRHPVVVAWPCFELGIDGTRLDEEECDMTCDVFRRLG